MQHLLHFRAVATELGLFVACIPAWSLIRGLNRVYPTKKHTKRVKEDLYYENGVAIPLDDLASRL